MNNAFEKMLFTQEGWSDFFRSDYVSKKTGETFSEVLSRYLDEIQAKYDLRQKEIADLSGIKPSLISKYNTGIRLPNLKVLVTLCLAMKLTPDRSEYLLYCAGFVLNNSKEHRIYKLFLDGCAFNENYSVENLNTVLIENGFDTE